MSWPTLVNLIIKGTRLSWVLWAGVASLLCAMLSVTTRADAQAGCTPGTTLNIVAHQDDDILFLSPHLIHDIQGGRCVRTVFLTAGDAGQSAAFWQRRELGSRAAYEVMNGGGAANWTQSDAGVAGHPIAVFTLTAKPNVSLAFMRLPDGSPAGGGYVSTNYETLQKLWQGTIPVLHAVDGSSGYTRADLTNTLVQLMASFQPDQVNTQDFVGAFGDGDHSDHHVAAYAALAAHQLYTTPHTFTGFQDYSIASLAPNVSGADLVLKQKAFQAYGQFDSRACSDATCSTSFANPWLPREYILRTEHGGAASGPATAPISAPPTPTPASTVVETPAAGPIDTPAMPMDTPAAPEPTMPADDGTGPAGSDGALPPAPDPSMVSEPLP